MCEFKVILDGEGVFDDAVYVERKQDKVVVRDVLGDSKEFQDCEITKVDVKSTRLVLSSI
ncbi:MAG: CooT family nickel-binding protein [Thermoproteota archaeon]